MRAIVTIVYEIEESTDSGYNNFNIMDGSFVEAKVSSLTEAKEYLEETILNEFGKDSTVEIKS